MRCNKHHWPTEEGECPFCKTEKANDAYLGIKADYTAARQEFARKLKCMRADVELAEDRAREAERLRNEDYAALQKGIQAIDMNNVLRAENAKQRKLLVKIADGTQAWSMDDLDALLEKHAAPEADRGGE